VDARRQDIQVQAGNAYHHGFEASILGAEPEYADCDRNGVGRTEENQQMVSSLSDSVCFSLPGATGSGAISMNCGNRAVKRPGWTRHASTFSAPGQGDVEGR